MARIFTLIGESGAGKTTMAVNLACALASQQYIVSIISANLENGELQVYFGENVNSQIGIFAGLNDTTDQQQNKMVQCEVNGNVFFISVPDKGPEALGEVYGRERIEQLINNIGVNCDVVLIDGRDDMHNEITLVGMAKANKIICMHKGERTGISWYQGHKTLMQQYPMVHILSMQNATIEGQEYSRLNDNCIEHEIPQVPEATWYKNVGRPIYFEKGKKLQFYKKELNKVVTALMEGYYGI